MMIRFVRVVAILMVLFEIILILNHHKYMLIDDGDSASKRVYQKPPDFGMVGGKTNPEGDQTDTENVKTKEKSLRDIKNLYNTSRKNNNEEHEPKNAWVVFDTISVVGDTFLMAGMLLENMTLVIIWLVVCVVTIPFNIYDPKPHPNSYRMRFRVHESASIGTETLTEYYELKSLNTQVSLYIVFMLLKMIITMFYTMASNSSVDIMPQATQRIQGIHHNTGRRQSFAHRSNTG